MKYPKAKKKAAKLPNLIAYLKLGDSIKKYKIVNIMLKQEIIKLLFKFWAF